MRRNQRSARIFEIIAVLATAAGKFIFIDYLKWRLPFIIAVILFWGGYVLYRTKRDAKTLRTWAFAATISWQ